MASTIKSPGLAADKLKKCWSRFANEAANFAQGFDSNKVVKEAYARYNLSIGVGLAQVNLTHMRDGTACSLRS